MSIPTQISGGPGQWFPVTEEDLGGKLGEFDGETGAIRIDPTQPEAGKHVILLHELLHLCEEKMIAAGVLERESPEAYITHLAGTLLPILAYSGLWQGCPLAELDAFFLEDSDIADARAALAEAERDGYHDCEDVKRELAL